MNPCIPNVLHAFDRRWRHETIALVSVTVFVENVAPLHHGKQAYTVHFVSLSVLLDCRLMVSYRGTENLHDFPETTSDVFFSGVAVRPGHFSFDFIFLVVMGEDFINPWLGCSKPRVTWPVLCGLAIVLFHTFYCNKKMFTT